ncbi:MAG: putative metal-binding motif-containing protein [Phycisphaerae bacterium]
MKSQSQQRSRGLAVVATAIVLGVGSMAMAYPRYNDGCQNCHGAFTSGTSPKGTVFPNNSKHDMHRSSNYMNTDCDLCHTSGDNRNPFLASSNGTSNNPGVGCTGCHGRDYGGSVGSSAVGLRAHHAAVGITFCGGCHPNEPTPLAEWVKPIYYGTADTRADEPCNDTGLEDWSGADGLGDGFGSDNDGDMLYDGNDPDCPTCVDLDTDGFTDCAGDCDDNNNTVYPGAPELCDGLDNDCNNLIDDGLGTTTCGVGECVNTVDNCVGGVPQVCDPFLGSTAEVCDGLDNDCNGLVDDGLGTTTCGVGECVNTVDNCVGGVPQVCDPLAGSTAETCDGLDNDCNGLVDDGLGTITCGVGECEVTVESCVNGLPNTCQPGTPGVEICDDGLDNDCDGLTDSQDVVDCPGCVPTAEICDGLDNDCNGVIDDGLGTTTCGVGECVNTVDNCVGGVPQVCDPFLGSSAETCDGLDNDCNGLVDDGLGTTTCGVGECVNTVDNCVGGVPQVCDPFAGSTAETCDGLDNDCNGLVDDGLGTTTCGVGECMHTVDNCLGGVPQVCDPFAGSTAEVCDGLDNDCNGLVDDGVCGDVIPLIKQLRVPKKVEVCNDSGVTKKIKVKVELDGVEGTTAEAMVDLFRGSTFEQSKTLMLTAGEKPEKVKFNVDISPADAPSIEWTVTVTLDNGASVSESAVTKVRCDDDDDGDDDDDDDDDDDHDDDDHDDDDDHGGHHGDKKVKAKPGVVSASK